jgi:hypothetical protein
MKKYLFNILTVALLTTMSTAAFASTDKKTEKELIGYEVTTVKYNTAKFNDADLNNDGFLTLDEYQNISLRDNTYSLFMIMDQNKDKLVDTQEFAEFAPGKGLTTVRHGQKRNWNLNQEKVIEKHYISVQ